MRFFAATDSTNTVLCVQHLLVVGWRQPELPQLAAMFKAAARLSSTIPAIPFTLMLIAVAFSVGSLACFAVATVATRAVASRIECGEWFLFTAFGTLLGGHDASPQADWLELDGNPALPSSSHIVAQI
jgi:hypothetical protein